MPRGALSHQRCYVQAKENHIPPNVQRPVGGAAPAADGAAAKLAAADKLRRQGNQLFKESRWAEAAAEYTRSVDALLSLGRSAPAETTALLLGNRAAARMMQVRPPRRPLVAPTSGLPGLCSLCVGCSVLGTREQGGPLDGGNTRVSVIVCSYLSCAAVRLDAGLTLISIAVWLAGCFDGTLRPRWYACMPSCGWRTYVVRCGLLRRMCAWTRLRALCECTPGAASASGRRPNTQLRLAMTVPGSQRLRTCVRTNSQLTAAAQCGGGLRARPDAGATRSGRGAERDAVRPQRGDR